MSSPSSHLPPASPIDHRALRSLVLSRRTTGFTVVCPDGSNLYVKIRRKHGAGYASPAYFVQIKHAQWINVGRLCLHDGTIQPSNARAEFCVWQLGVIQQIWNGTAPTLEVWEHRLCEASHLAGTQRDYLMDPVSIKRGYGDSCAKAWAPVAGRPSARSKPKPWYLGPDVIGDLDSTGGDQ